VHTLLLPNLRVEFFGSSATVGDVRVPQLLQRSSHLTLALDGSPPEFYAHRIDLRKITSAKMDESGRHLLHEFMTGQRPRPKPNKWVNGSLWTVMLLLLATLAYLLHGEVTRAPPEQPDTLYSKNPAREG
jgi:hypothetical protein